MSALAIIAVGLGAAFLLGLLKPSQRHEAFAISLVALAVMAGLACYWVLALTTGSAQPMAISTAGASPPFAIGLYIGKAEAWMLALVNVTGLLGALYLRPALLQLGRRSMAVLLVMMMALSGLVLTRDLFNIFVFLELIVIATAGLVLLSDDQRALAAGFKYLVISQIVSILMLIGIVFTYHANGSLGLDDIAAIPLMLEGSGLAVFLLLIAVLIELKPFPANGWALDIYESAHPGFSALFAAASGSAIVLAADKLLAAAGPAWLPLATAIGLLSFLVSNVIALAQRNDRRLLGYSSVAQMGLVLAVVGQRDILGAQYLFVAGGIVLSHALAKAGLFWLSGLVAGRDLTGWSILRQRPVLLLAFVSFIAMLIGLPPFPGFYAKWDLAHALAAADRLPTLLLILLGTLIEAGYLFRWFGQAVKGDVASDSPTDLSTREHRLRSGIVVITLGLGWILGMAWGSASGNTNLMALAPLQFALVFLLLEPLPARIKNAIAIAGLLGWFWWRLPDYDPLQLVFAVVMLVGGAILLIAGFRVSGTRPGFYPPTLLMYAGLALLIDAQTTFEFFAAWELLTIGSYFLILRGRLGEPHALSYLLFSLGGALLILAGFSLAAFGPQPMAISSLATLAESGHSAAPWVFVLLAIGFMTKTASIGLHVWLPGAHAEAETDVSPVVSGILLKAGLYGLWLLVMYMGHQQLHGIELTHVLAWVGALSALLGALMAAFEEDAKRLLAYSSISQMGYALFGLSLMNHLGWLLVLMFVINHFVYKSMLFLAIGGVYQRTGTKLMYRMGGLITLMPFTFVSVLVGIIAMSGVPPLSGYGGRWLFYNAIMASELRLPMVLVFLSGPVSFLYLFRLIHTIFLGQLKDEHRRIREASIWLLIPQMLFVGFLLAFAVLPGLVLQKVDAYIGAIFNDQPLLWTGRAITSTFGYWNPVAIMLVIGTIFVLVLLLLMAMGLNAQKVRQFNIVFAAERPYRPETTHFAWNFFAPYRKAVGFLVSPLVTAFWAAITDTLASIAEFTRRLYTGNAQTYALHALLFVAAIYLAGLGVAQ